MRKQKNKILDCPECAGRGTIRRLVPGTDMYRSESDYLTETCFYCSGYGYQQDEDDSFEPFYKDK